MCLSMRIKQPPEKILAMTETANEPNRKTTEFSDFQQKDANSGKCTYFHCYTKNIHLKNGTERNKTSNCQ